jgi:predicted DNA-binding transcriptional regulator
MPVNVKYEVFSQRKAGSLLSSTTFKAQPIMVYTLLVYLMEKNW